MATLDGRTRLSLGIGFVLTGIFVAMVLFAGRDSSSVGSVEPVLAESADDQVEVSMPPTTAVPVTDIGPDSSLGESTSVPSPPPVTCVLSGEPLVYGNSGEDVSCLQEVLISAKILDMTPNGTFDDVTLKAVATFQSQQGQRVDGVVGRITGTALGIWPPDLATVLRTPVPPPGATDLWGMPLSSVATSGPDSPPLPPESGRGYRLVYDRAAQRVWAVDHDEIVIRSWLVSGSRTDNEIPGTHRVYSRARTSNSLDGESTFSYMVRWLKTDGDAIGFHSLPRRATDGILYQSDEELGIPLSSGCQRQADLDAKFTWRFARLGTVVVVI
ncbi:MAG: L,D-transpeptidase family protein [Ilumatobacteraceae bacterium]